MRIELVIDIGQWWVAWTTAISAWWVQHGAQIAKVVLGVGLTVSLVYMWAALNALWDAHEKDRKRARGRAEAG